MPLDERQQLRSVEETWRLQLRIGREGLRWYDLREVPTTAVVSVWIAEFAKFSVCASGIKSHVLFSVQFLLKFFMPYAF